jgi:benzoate membrane transport protein
MNKTSTIEENQIKEKLHKSFFNNYSNILPPIIAGLISVIVNYGGTFILIFQAAQIAGLSPELTASWVWSISIGVGITGILLSW